MYKTSNINKKVSDWIDRSFKHNTLSQNVNRYFNKQVILFIFRRLKCILIMHFIKLPLIIKLTILKIGILCLIYILSNIQLLIDNILIQGWIDNPQIFLISKSWCFTKLCEVNYILYWMSVYIYIFHKRFNLWVRFAGIILLSSITFWEFYVDLWVYHFLSIISYI